MRRLLYLPLKLQPKTPNQTICNTTPHLPLAEILSIREYPSKVKGCTGLPPTLGLCYLWAATEGEGGLGGGGVVGVVVELELGIVTRC